MLSYIKGQIIAIKEQSVTVLIENLNIGLEIFIINSEFYKISQDIILYTYMHWNQEQGPTLYGFNNESQKNIFLLVISCSGIGPKIGLSVISQMQPNEFIRAIHEQDIKALSSINGIGTKKAEQIIVQLKHKISNLIESGLISDNENSTTFKNIKNVSEVLQSLNYSKPEISNALDYIKSNSDKNLTFDLMLRQALSYLAKRK